MQLLVAQLRRGHRREVRERPVADRVEYVETTERRELVAKVAEHEPDQLLGLSLPRDGHRTRAGNTTRLNSRSHGGRRQQDEHYRRERHAHAVPLHELARAIGNARGVRGHRLVREIGVQIERECIRGCVASLAVALERVQDHGIEIARERAAQRAVIDAPLGRDERAPLRR